MKTPNMLCPFRNDVCTFDCVFNNGTADLDDSDVCNLTLISQFCGSWLSPDSDFDKQTKDMISKLSDIETNTSSDQTSSAQILDTLTEIKNLLSKNQN